MGGLSESFGGVGHLYGGDKGQLRWAASLCVCFSEVTRVSLKGRTDTLTYSARQIAGFRTN